MNTILNNVKTAALNVMQAIASLLVPAGASTEARTKAELAILGHSPEVPQWLQELQPVIEGRASLLMARGARVAVAGGILDGSDQLALVKFWGAPSEENAKSKGATVWASTEAGKVFAYFRAWGTKPGAANPEAEVTALSPETGEVEDWRMAVPEGIACLKFKLEAFGHRHEQAVTAISNYVATQDGTRKDYVLLAQCAGKHRTECNKLGIPVVLNGKNITVQPIKGYILFEVPRVSTKGNANLREVCAPQPTLAQMADAAAEPAGRVTPVMSIDASPLAAASEL